MIVQLVCQKTMHRVSSVKPGTHYLYIRAVSYKLIRVVCTGL